MFAVPFQTAMSDADIHRLNSVLGMDTHLHPKLRGSPASPGVSRLDFFSGLFLVRGDGPQDWRLEGRTWGAPAPESVQGWHLARGRRGTAAGSHGPGAVAARDPWPPNDHRRTEQGNSSSVDPLALQPPAPQGGLPARPRSRSGRAGAAGPYHGYLVCLSHCGGRVAEASRARAGPPAPRRGRATFVSRTRGRRPRRAPPSRHALLIAGLTLSWSSTAPATTVPKRRPCSRRSMDGTIAGIDPRVARGA
jgi:hypothetical protein